MKYKTEIDLVAFSELRFGEHIYELETTFDCNLRTAVFIHKATGVIIKLEETWSILNHLYAESDSSKALNNFQDHLKIIGIS